MAGLGTMFASSDFFRTSLHWSRGARHVLGSAAHWHARRGLQPPWPQIATQLSQTFLELAWCDSVLNQGATCLGNPFGSCSILACRHNPGFVVTADRRPFCSAFWCSACGACVWLIFVFNRSRGYADPSQRPPVDAAGWCAGEHEVLVSAYDEYLQASCFATISGIGCEWQPAVQ